MTPGPHTDGIRRFLRHPIGMVGTDSTFVGEKPSPRTWGSFPRILGQFVRDEGILGLEEAIRRMTSAPAARLGLRDRGMIRDGAAAWLDLKTGFGNVHNGLEASDRPAPNDESVDVHARTAYGDITIRRASAA